MKVMQFSAVWCAPCKALKEVIKNANFTTEFQYVDVDVQKDLCENYKIRSVPTLVLLNDKGEEVDRKIGFQSEKQLREWIGE